MGSAESFYSEVRGNLRSLEAQDELIEELIEELIVRFQQDEFTVEFYFGAEKLRG